MATQGIGRTQGIGDTSGLSNVQQRQGHMPGHRSITNNTHIGPHYACTSPAFQQAATLSRALDNAIAAAFDAEGEFEPGPLTPQAQAMSSAPPQQYRFIPAIQPQPQFRFIPATSAQPSRTPVPQNQRGINRAELEGVVAADLAEEQEMHNLTTATQNHVQNAQNASALARIKYQGMVRMCDTFNIECPTVTDPAGAAFPNVQPFYEQAAQAQEKALKLVRENKYPQARQAFREAQALAEQAQAQLARVEAGWTVLDQIRTHHDNRNTARTEVNTIQASCNEATTLANTIMRRFPRTSNAYGAAQEAMNTITRIRREAPNSLRNIETQEQNARRAAKAGSSQGVRSATNASQAASRSITSHMQEAQNIVRDLRFVLEQPR